MDQRVAHLVGTASLLARATVVFGAQLLVATGWSMWCSGRAGVARWLPDWSFTTATASPSTTVFTTWSHWVTQRILDSMRGDDGG